MLRIHEGKIVQHWFRSLLALRLLRGDSTKLVKTWAQARSTHKIITWNIRSETVHFHESSEVTKLFNVQFTIDGGLIGRFYKLLDVL